MHARLPCWRTCQFLMPVPFPHHVVAATHLPSNNLSNINGASCLLPTLHKVLSQKNAVGCVLTYIRLVSFMRTVLDYMTACDREHTVHLLCPPAALPTQAQHVCHMLG